MYKFKVGDKVVRKPRKDNPAFEVLQGVFDYYTITSVSVGGCWLQLDSVIDSREKDTHPWHALNFELYQEPEDELPPVPRSVSYLKENGRRKLTACIHGGDLVNVKLSLDYWGKPEALGYSMEPDAALQLAHDLRRMAMEIKRKEKAQ